ncbi:MAG: O-antigen ligase [Candidatus Endobugula sp.]|jgi:O-antigen ligase
MRTRSIRITSTADDKWLLYGLMGLIIYLPLPLGSNRLWAWAFGEAWIFSLSASWIILNAQNKVSLPAYWKKCWLPITALSCLLTVSLVQLLPWNLSSTSPISIMADIEWRQISLDPHATLQASLKTFSYLCLFMLVIALINTEKRIRTLLLCFFFCGLFQAMYGGLMTLSGIEYIFFMEKYAYIGKATGTFINRNHFANYLIICIAAGTAILLIDLSSKKSANFKALIVKTLQFILSAKMLLRIGLAISVVGIVLSQSRMGNTAFFVSLTVSGTIWIILTRRISRNAILFLISIIIIDLLIVGKWFGFEKVQQRLQSTSLQAETRDEVIRDTLLYIDDHLLMGTGGGSYYSVYPHYQSDDVKGFYKHTHNDYLQFLSEYGIIGSLFISLFILSTLCTALSTMLKRKNKTLQAVSFSGTMIIVALIMHSHVDFNLQIMANAASVVIFCSLVYVARHLPTKKRLHV